MSYNERNVNLNEQSSASQNEQILHYLKSGESLTSLESLWLCGSLRLPSRIWDLKERGNPIESVTVYRKPDKARGLRMKKFSAYYLPDAVREKYKLEGLDDGMVEVFVAEITTARINKREND